MVVTAVDGAVGALKMAGNPIKMSEFADPPVRPAAPDLGHDQERVTSELAE